MKTAMIGVALLLLGAGGGLLYVSKYPAHPQRTPAAPSPSPVGTGLCAAHGVPEGDCPWCDESLIETKGQCGGHDVPEALCSRCNASLIPGFKAVGDWCGGHDLPESQCATCKGGELPPGETPVAASEHDSGADGAFCGTHQIAEAECPWCDASLIEAMQPSTRVPRSESPRNSASWSA